MKPAWWSMSLQLCAALVGFCQQPAVASTSDIAGLHSVYKSSSDLLYSGDSANVSQLLDSLLTGYDKRIRPNYKGRPVEVGITMHVSSVSSISEVDMDFTLDIYFRQYWNDPRLRFDSNEEELCISNEMLAKIWWPDTFFANAKDAKFHQATTKNAFLRINSNGDVLQSLRLTVTSFCTMDLTYFPMDSQICSLEIESYGYSVKDISYTWKDGIRKSVTISDGVQLPQFTVRGHRAKHKIETLTTGNYSRLSCEFYFVRSLGYYFIQIYVPSTLIVVLSWVSFWLSREAVPARVALGITTVLTMTTLISSTNASLPKISYLKSIDVYLVTCFFMVFGALIEYAAVSYLENRKKRRLRKGPGETAKIDHPNDDKRNGTPAVPSYQTFTSEIPHLVHTEVRLSSMRKLHTECDLRTLTTPTNSPYPMLNSSSASVTQRRANPHAGSSPHATSAPHRRKDDNKSDVTCSTCHTCFCQKPSDIDKYSRLMFPLSFVAFTILYWASYLNINQHSENQDFVFLDK